MCSARPAPRDAESAVPTAALMAAARVLAVRAAMQPGGHASRDAGHRAGTRARRLQLDEAAQTHLELVRAADGGRTGSLLADHRRDLYPRRGRALLRRWLLAPLLDVGAIRRRLDAVEVFVQQPAGARRAARDARARWAISSGSPCAPRSVKRRPRIWAPCATGSLAAPGAVGAVASTCPTWASSDALDLHRRSPRRARAHRRAASARRARRRARRARRATAGSSATDSTRELDETRRLKEQRDRADPRARGASCARARASRRSKIRYTRVFGWYIEVTRPTSAKAPTYVAPQADRRGRRALHERRARRARRTASRTPKDARLERETELFAALVSTRRAAHARARSASSRRGSPTGTCTRALAEVAHRHDYVRPEVDAERRDRHRGRAPPGGRAARRSGAFVPNDIARSMLERRAPLARHGAQHGGQIDPHAPGRAHRHPRADGQLRARARARASGSSTGCSRAWARATTSRAARAPSWSRCARPRTSCSAPRGARSSSSTRLAAAPAPTTGSPSRGPSPSTSTTPSAAARSSRRTTTSSPSSRETAPARRELLGRRRASTGDDVVFLHKLAARPGEPELRRRGGAPRRASRARFGSRQGHFDLARSGGRAPFGGARVGAWALAGRQGAARPVRRAEALARSDQPGARPAESRRYRPAYPARSADLARQAENAGLTPRWRAPRPRGTARVP